MKDDVPIANEDFTWHEYWDVSPQGFSKDPDSRFYGDESPNDPPAIDVDVKMATDIEIEEDSELATRAAETIGMGKPDKYTSVAVVAFNDMSTWHIPLRPWAEDNAEMRMFAVDSFIFDVIQWRAVIEGEDPQKRLDRWLKQFESDEEDWAEDVGDTELTDEQREWFNNHADWVDYIDRKVESNADEVDLDVEDDYSWEDDW